MNKKDNKKITTEYIQFSKRVTKWGVILVTVTLIICLSLIAFLGLDTYKITTIGQLYTTYITIMGITIGAYQGNSSLEKWTNARYQFDKTLTKRKEINADNYSEENETIIEED